MTVPISHIKNLTTLISVRVDIECHILTCIHREIETLDIKQLLSDIKNTTHLIELACERYA